MKSFKIKPMFYLSYPHYVGSFEPGGNTNGGKIYPWPQSPETSRQISKSIASRPIRCVHG